MEYAHLCERMGTSLYAPEVPSLKLSSECEAVLVLRKKQSPSRTGRVSSTGRWTQGHCHNRKLLMREDSYGRVAGGRAGKQLRVGVSGGDGSHPGFMGSETLHLDTLHCSGERTNSHEGDRGRWYPLPGYLKF